MAKGQSTWKKKLILFENQWKDLEGTGLTHLGSQRSTVAKCEIVTLTPVTLSDM